MAIIQIMQESVPEAERGRVFGVQTSLCQLFALIKDLALICLPEPRTYSLLIVGSYTATTLGALCYMHHLFFPK